MTPYEDIANRIYSNKFGVYGQGNFDLTVKEFAEVLRIAMSAETEQDVEEELKNYYNKLK